MQLPQIRYFLALCDEHSFTRAARRSGVSQPSLTNAIRALEEELGGALFQRRPTYFKRMAETADHAVAVAQALTDTNRARPEAAIASQFRHDVPT